MVHFEIVCCLGDQPERRSINYIMNGNSSYCPRYVSVYNCSEIIDMIPSCDECLGTMLSNDRFDNSTISNCLNCDCMNDQIKSSCSPLKMFPKDVYLHNIKVSPKEINWCLLRNAIYQASCSFYEGRWNEGNVRAYLSTFEINNTGSINVISHCHNKKALINAINDPNNNRNSMMII